MDWPAAVASRRKRRGRSSWKEAGRLQPCSARFDRRSNLPLVQAVCAGNGRRPSHVYHRSPLTDLRVCRLNPVDPLSGEVDAGLCAGVGKEHVAIAQIIREGVLLAKVADFGETPNSVLRRELLLNGAGPSPAQGKPSPLQELLDSSDYRFAKGAVGRFLAILGWLYKKHRDSFSAVENLKGRGRIYFSTSEADLHASGKSVNPKRIPGSPYWVITTTSTDLKQEILSQVMKSLGYELSERQLAMRAIAR